MCHGPGGGNGTCDRHPRGAAAGRQDPLHQLRQGRAFWETDAEAARFVNDFQEIVSTDHYWFTDPNQSSMTAPPWLPEGANGNWPTISGATV